MLIGGAGGHAIEVLDIFQKNQYSKVIIFFDDFSLDLYTPISNNFTIIRNVKDLYSVFKLDPDYVLGIGGTKNRKTLEEKLTSAGGILNSIIANNALIGNVEVVLNLGVNIMNNVYISNHVTIGKGTLINANVNIHHDSIIGDFCEIAPSAVILGGCTIGSSTSIGSNTTLLPKIKIGSNCIIGAGSLVTKNLPDNVIAYGVPAKIIREKK